MSTNQRPGVMTGKQTRPRSLHPNHIALIGVFRDAMADTVRGVRPLLTRRWVFDNAGDQGRNCPTDLLARAYDDALDALKAMPIDEAQKLEQALALPRAMEAAARARFAPTPLVSLTDVILAEGRADAIADPHEQEVLADLRCETKRARLLTVWQHHRARLDRGIQWLQQHAGFNSRGVA